MMSYRSPWLVIAIFSLISISLVGCSPGRNNRDENDAVMAAKTITANREQVERMVSEVMESVELDNAESILAGIRVYEEAEALLVESVRLSRESTQPRLDRFALRYRIAAGYQALYALSDQICTPYEKSGAVPPADQVQRRAEAEVGAKKWLRLSQKDMDFHLRSTTVAYQVPKNYWDLQQIYVALGDYGSARTTLLALVDAFGQTLKAADRREIESRIRHYAQRLNDLES